MDIPSSHLIFIPAVLLVGMALGFILGNRAARDAYNLELRRQAERDAARKARAEKKAARAKADSEAFDDTEKDPDLPKKGDGTSPKMDTATQSDDGSESEEPNAKRTAPE